MLRGMAVHSLGLATALGLLLFPPAGTLAWARAWTFIALFVGCSEATGAWLIKHNPDLLAARMESPFRSDQRPRDRVVMGAIMVAFCGWLVFMALDAERFRWSHTPIWAQALGATLIVGAFRGWLGVLRVNSFAATTIRVQSERSHHVVSSGPYAVVRHPMYAYALLLIIGVPLLLGSLWGLLGTIVFVPLLMARVLGEEATLLKGLPGYRAYTAKVRVRLLPGLW